MKPVPLKPKDGLNGPPANKLVEKIDSTLMRLTDVSPMKSCRMLSVRRLTCGADKTRVVDEVVVTFSSFQVP